MKVTINNKKFIDNKYTYVVCYYIDFGGQYEFANSIEDIDEDDRCYVEFPFKAMASQFLLLTDEMVKNHGELNTYIFLDKVRNSVYDNFMNSRMLKI